MMTRVEIWEGMNKIIKASLLRLTQVEDDPYITKTESFWRDEIIKETRLQMLKFLDKSGVVIRVERELLEPEDVNEEPEMEFKQGWYACVNSYEEAGYAAVESLLEEE